MLKYYNKIREKCKNVRQLSQGKQMKDDDPQVELEINGYIVRQVVIKFGLQVNVLSCKRWISMGSLNLHRTNGYLKIFDQIFIEPIRTLRQVKTSIMVILAIINFQVIDLVDNIPAYPQRVDRLWGQRMKATISLEKRQN